MSDNTEKIKSDTSVKLIIAGAGITSINIILSSFIPNIIYAFLFGLGLGLMFASNYVASSALAVTREERNEARIKFKDIYD